MEGDGSGEGGEHVGEGRLEQLLENFLNVQHRRAAVYNRLHRAFAEYMRTSAEVPFQELCRQVTSDFSECSRQVLDIEAALRGPGIGRADLASVLQNVQLQEKEKLQMTATLQVLRRAGRPSERPGTTDHGPEHTVHSHHLGPPPTHSPGFEGNSGLEMAQLEAEYEAAVKEATGALQETVLAINEYIEEVRYEIEELRQRRTTATLPTSA